MKSFKPLLPHVLTAVAGFAVASLLWSRPSTTPNTVPVFGADVQVIRTPMIGEDTLGPSDNWFLRPYRVIVDGKKYDYADPPESGEAWLFIFQNGRVKVHVTPCPPPQP